MKGGINIMQMQKLMPKNKTGGVVTSTVMGVGGLIIGVIVILVVIQTLNNASLLTAGSAESDASGNLSTNFTTGIGKIDYQKHQTQQNQQSLMLQVIYQLISLLELERLHKRFQRFY